MSPKDILGIVQQLAQHHKRFPKIAEITAQTGVPEYKVKMALKALVARGDLIQRGNWYRFPNEAIDLQAYNRVHKTIEMDETQEAETPLERLQEFARATPFKVSKIKEAAKKIQTYSVPAVSSHREWFIIAIRVMMGLIGCGAIILSAYYTSLWAKDYLPVFWATILSGVVVSFSAFAFEVSIMYFRERKRMAGVAFFLLWLVGMSYSITTTIAGQYNAFVIIETRILEAKAVQSADAQALATYRQQEVDATRGVDTTTTKLDTMYAIMKDAGQTADKRFEYKNTWKDTLYTISTMESDLKRFQADRKKAQDEIQAALRASPALAKQDQVDAIPDFYQWVATVLKVNRNMAQFIMGLFPAIFIDFLAPAALTVALFFTPAGTRQKPFSIWADGLKKIFKKKA